MSEALLLPRPPISTTPIRTAGRSWLTTHRHLSTKDRQDLRRLILLTILLLVFLARPKPSQSAEGRIGVSARVVAVQPAREAGAVTQDAWSLYRAVRDSTASLEGPWSPAWLQQLETRGWGERDLGHGMARFQWIESDSTRSAVLQIEWTGN